MKVQVKLRLADETAHLSLSSVLSPFPPRTHFQHNVFFDGASSELSALRAVLRLRFYGEDPKTAERCVSSLKAKAILDNGVSRVEEDEEDIDPFLAREIWANPNLIGSSDSRVLKRVKEEFGVKDESGFVCLGEFKNVRRVYDWKGLRLEVDETLFDFGTWYEIECESSEPDTAKEMIEELLKDHYIPYSYSEMSKFAIFRSGVLPLLDSKILLSYTNIPPYMPRDIKSIKEYFSWANHPLIRVEGRKQHEGNCAYYSYASCIEVRSQILWKDKGVLEERKMYTVDIPWLMLVDTYKNAAWITKMVKQNFCGRIRATEDPYTYPFYVDDCEKIILDSDKRGWLDKIEKVKESMAMEGAVIGSFYLDKDEFKRCMVEHRVFNQRVKVTKPECSHAVCLVGYLKLIKKKKWQEAFEFVDSNFVPKPEDPHKTRILLASVLKVVYIPVMKHVPDNELGSIPEQGDQGDPGGAMEPYSQDFWEKKRSRLEEEESDRMNKQLKRETK